MNEPNIRDDSRRQRVDHLATLQLQSEITETELRELELLLKEDSQAVRQYVESIADSAGLRWISESAQINNMLDRETDGEFCEKAKLHRRHSNDAKAARYGLPLALLACSLLAAALLVVSSIGSREVVLEDAKPEVNDDVVRKVESPSKLFSKPASDSQVATVLRAHNVAWSRDNSNIRELSRLSVGQALHFSSGEVELVFDRAVRMLVRGPALLEIRSPSEVYSRFGVLSARVGEAGKGFVIETPSGRIVDLGTEFGVAVDQRGATDIAVFRGAVDLTCGAREDMLSPSITRRLVQGQALSLGADGSMKRLVAYDGTRFPLFHHGTFDWPVKSPSIFSSVADNIPDRIDAKSYRIVPGGLREDVLAYVDRQHEWNGIDAKGIPELLLGADYIMPFNEDKYFSELNVEVSIGRPARLFIFLSHMAKVPDWLSRDFEKTDMMIGLDESGEFVTAEGYRIDSGPGQAVDTEFYVWQRDVELPTNIMLGSLRQARRGWGFCMYGIAAVPLEVAREYDSLAVE